VKDLRAWPGRTTSTALTPMHPVVYVPDDAADFPEAVGTKPKFWFLDGTKRRTLYKEGRPHSGENWAEKICCELCRFLSIPHADYELAEWRGRKGVVSTTFVPDGARLVLGNELLARVVPDYPDYPRAKRFKTRQHTVRLVMAVMSARVIGLPLGYQAPVELRDAADVLVGYLLLDALVGNQDRHHENWGLILLADQSVVLAPTFDHASSLGRNERDEERLRRLATRDKGSTVEHYVERATSALFATPASPTPLTTMAAFAEAARISPRAAHYWLSRVEQLDTQKVQQIIANIPAAEMSEPARRFSEKMIEVNRKRLLSLGSDKS
jgi:hypothetical protein